MKDDLWKLLKKIPKGKVTTYKALADKLQTSPRAIGAFLHSNKDPDNVPCYKVVMSDGSVGGFALGVGDKVRRLEADGVEVKNGRIIDFPNRLDTLKDSGGWI